jgi:hypothetical protein
MFAKGKSPSDLVRVIGWQPGVSPASARKKVAISE